MSVVCYAWIGVIAGIPCLMSIRGLRSDCIEYLSSETNADESELKTEGWTIKECEIYLTSPTDKIESLQNNNRVLMHNLNHVSPN